MNKEEFADKAQRSHTVLYSRSVGDSEENVEDPNTERSVDSKGKGCPQDASEGNNDFIRNWP